VPQHQQLGFLRRIPAEKQHQQSQEVPDDQYTSERITPRSCQPIPRRRETAAHKPHPVIERHTIFRDGYEEVMRRLVGGLRYMRTWRRDWHVPTTGTIAQARVRMGEEPLKRLFERVAVPLASPAAAGCWLRSRRLMAIDGLKLDIPDTADNVAAFGRPASATRRPFPQIQVIGLGECGTHAIVAANIGTLSVGERELAAGVLASMGADMLVTADRGFHSFRFWQQCMATGADLLVRAENRGSAVSSCGFVEFEPWARRSVRQDAGRGCLAGLPCRAPRA